ncbi:hypothetical protein LCGC14_2761470, partial [marine sediment metagenome]
WGPGIALVWANGRAAKINLRLEDRKFGVVGGDGLRITGGPVTHERPETVRIVLDDQTVHFLAKAGTRWRLIDSQSRNNLQGDPVAVRLGKLAENGSWEDFPGVPGTHGKCAFRHLRVLGK